MASSIWGGVRGPPEYGPGRPRTMYNIKQIVVEVFACLGSSHGFLSTIFGILGKFWIDIGKNIFRKYFFSRPKKILEQNENIFSFFFWQKIKILRNRNFGNFEILEDFQNFEILIFQTFHFLSEKNLKIVLFFFQYFVWSWKKIFSKNIFTYINSKFPQDSKNRT